MYPEHFALTAPEGSNIRTLEVGFPDGTRNYATVPNCLRAVAAVTSKMRGICNVRIVPALPSADDAPSSPVRYTAILSCFSDEQDLCFAARAGFMVYR